MLIPVGDINRRTSTPWVNYLLIALNVAAFAFILIQETEGAILAVYNDYALFPNRFQVTDLFTSMFLHASPAHLIGNMLFLWIVGDNIEDRYGHGMYIAFYLAAGIMAGVVHIVTIEPGHAGVPTVGASGAISGMMGAYFILFPRASILFWVFPWSLFAGLIRIPSFLAIGAWFIMQLLMVSDSQAGKAESVAYWAHIGGFVFGLLVTLILRVLGVITPGKYLPQESS